VTLLLVKVHKHIYTYTIFYHGEKYVRRKVSAFEDVVCLFLLGFYSLIKWRNERKKKPHNAGGRYIKSLQGPLQPGPG
jgi:hypothetical protein